MTPDMERIAREAGYVLPQPTWVTVTTTTRVVQSNKPAAMVRALQRAAAARARFGLAA